MPPAPLLDEALLADLRTRQDPAEYDRLLRGFAWKNDILRIGRHVKPLSDHRDRYQHLLRLVADAPAGSKLAPPLREQVPGVTGLASEHLDAACLRGFTRIRRLSVGDTDTVRGLDTLSTLPALTEVELTGVGAIRDGERFASASLTALRAKHVMRTPIPALRLLPHLGDLPKLEWLGTRTQRDEDLDVLETACPQLRSLELGGVLPADLRPLGRRSLRLLWLRAAQIDVASLPALPALESAILTASAPQDYHTKPAPLTLSLDDARFPALRRFEVMATAEITHVPPALEELSLGQLAAGFEVRLQRATAVKKLALKSEAAPLDLGFLRWFPALETLDLDGPGFTSFDGLAACPSLTKLSLHQLTAATDASYLRTHPVPELQATSDQRALLGLPQRGW